MANTHVHFNKHFIALSNGKHHIQFHRATTTPEQINEAITLLSGENPTYTYTGASSTVVDALINHTCYAENYNSFLWTRAHCLALSFASQRATVLQAINWGTEERDAELARDLYYSKSAHIVFTDYARDHYAGMGERSGGAWLSTSRFAITPHEGAVPVVVGEAQMIVDAINAHNDGRPIVIFSDSLRCVRAFERGRFDRFEGLPGGVEAMERARAGGVYVFKVGAHSFNVGNELVDALAQCARRGYEAGGRIGELPGWVSWFADLAGVL